MLVLTILLCMCKLIISANTTCRVDVSTWGGNTLEGEAILNVTQANAQDQFGLFEVASFNVKDFIKASGVFTTKEQTFALGGTVGFNEFGNLYNMTIDNTLSGYAVVRSYNYQPDVPGTPQRVVIDAAFNAPVANSLQGAGLVLVTDGFYIGYLGEDFGCVYQRNGMVEIFSTTIDVNGVGNVDVTHFGGTTSVALGATREDSAQLICEFLASLSPPVYNYLAVENVVYAIGRDTQFPLGGFSVDPAASGATITNTQVQQLRLKDESVNTDYLTDISFLDPTKLNIYELDYGKSVMGMKVSVYNPFKKSFVELCEITTANEQSFPQFNYANFKVGWALASLGSTTPMALTGSNAAIGNIEGSDTHTDNGALYFQADQSIGNLPLTETYFLTIKVNRLLNEKQVFGFLEFKLSQFTTLSTRGAEFYLYKNCEISGTENFEYVNKDNSIALVDKSGTGCIGGQLVKKVGLGRYQTVQLNLEDINLKLLIGETLTITGNSVINTNDAFIDITWEERI